MKNNSTGSCGVMLWGFPTSMYDFIPALIMVSYVWLFSCKYSRWSASFFHLSARPSRFLIRAFRKGGYAYQYSSSSRLTCLVRPLVLICHCKPQNRIITCAAVSFNVFVLSADNSCRIEPHVHKHVPFALCSLHFSH